MRQCELQKVVLGKANEKARRTGEKLVCFIDNVNDDMLGALIDLKKVEGLWVIDKIHNQEIERYQIKRNWHLGDL